MVRNACSRKFLIPYDTLRMFTYRTDLDRIFLCTRGFLIRTTAVKKARQREKVTDLQLQPHVKQVGERLGSALHSAVSADGRVSNRKTHQALTCKDTIVYTPTYVCRCPESAAAAYI